MRHAHAGLRYLDASKASERVAKASKGAEHQAIEPAEQVGIDQDVLVAEDQTQRGREAYDGQRDATQPLTRGVAHDPRPDEIELLLHRE